MHANLPMTEFLPAPSCAKSDIVRRFLAWVQSADTDARAQGASALARAYLYSDLPASVRAEAALAMTALLDDPSILVRRALAEALCRAHEAPRTLILALAADEPEAAAPVLQHSPVLTEADLVDCVASGDACCSDGAGAPAKPAASRKSRAGRDRAIRCGSRAHRQSRDRLSSGTAAPHFCPLRRRREPARSAARAPRAAGSLEGAHCGGGGQGSGRRGVAMDGARASRARRPRSARSGDLHDRLVMPSRRAGGAYACAARRWRTHASLAAAFAAWRRTDSVRAGFGGTVGPADAARRRLYARTAGGRIRRARPPGWPEGRRPVSPFAPRSPRSKRMPARLATGSNCRSCKRSSTHASSSTIRRSPRFGRCCGASPPKRRRRKPQSFAREAAASASSGRLPPLLEFSPVNDDSGHAPKLTADFGWPPTGAAMLELARPCEFGRG